MLVVAIAPGEFLFLAPRYGMAGMRAVEEVRHARLLELLAEFPTTQALADKLGKSHAQLSQWKNQSARRKDGVEIGKSNIDSKSARAIEDLTGKPRGWMDTDPDLAPAAWPFQGFTPAALAALDAGTLAKIEAGIAFMLAAGTPAGAPQSKQQSMAA